MSHIVHHGKFLGPDETKFDLGDNSEMTAGQFGIPLNCDWAWRPEEFYQEAVICPQASPKSGVKIGPNTKLFFNGPTPSLEVWAQSKISDRNSVGLGLTLDDFAGDFLSLSFAAPDGAVAHMTKFTLFRCDFVVASDHPVTLYARLNVKYGPSVAQFTQTVGVAEGHKSVTFDLGFHPFQVGDFSKIWLDMIINSPAQNQIVIHDLTLLRHPRGQF